MFSGGWFWGGWARGQNVEFDFGDLFGNMWDQQGRTRSSSQYDTRQEAPKKPVTLDFEKTYEVPVFDMILGCKIEVTGVYGQKAKLTIPAWTKSWAKFRVKEFGKSEGSKKWNLIVKVDAKMPKNISDVDKWLLEQIRDNIGY
jgi:DnaJ-class molecular chaperone